MRLEPWMWLFPPRFCHLLSVLLRYLMMMLMKIKSTPD